MCDGIRVALIVLAVGFMFLFLLLPLAAVFVEAFRSGLGAYFKAITEPDALAAIKLTLLVAAIAVPIPPAARTLVAPQELATGAMTALAVVPLFSVLAMLVWRGGKRLGLRVGLVFQHDFGVVARGHDQHQLLQHRRRVQRRDPARRDGAHRRR